MLMDIKDLIKNLNQLWFLSSEFVIAWKSFMSNPSFAPLSPDRNLMKRRTKLTWHGDKYYTFVTQNLKDLTVYLLYVCCKTFVYTDIFREFSHRISQVKMQHFTLQNMEIYFEFKTIYLFLSVKCANLLLVYTL